MLETISHRCLVPLALFIQYSNTENHKALVWKLTRKRKGFIQSCTASGSVNTVLVLLCIIKHWFGNSHETEKGFKSVGVSMAAQSQLTGSLFNTRLTHGSLSALRSYRTGLGKH